MHLRTLVVLACVLISQFVLCGDLKITDLGACEKTTYKRTLISVFFIDIRRSGKTKCPRGSKTCKDEDLKEKGEAFDPKTHICCAKSKMEPKITIVCCEGWTYNVTTEKCQAQCDYGCENGICVMPNTCQCEPPLVLENENKCVQPKCDNTNSSSCDKPCDGPCNNGTCTQDGICICSDGFQLNNGSCSPITEECRSCDGNCTSVDGKPCLHDSGVQSEAVSPALASLGWVFIGVVVLLVALLLVVLHRTWRRRREYETKTADEGNPYGSVIYTVPNTLIPKDLHNDPLEEDDEFDGEEVKKPTNEPLLDTVTNNVLTSVRETNHNGK